MSHYSNVNYSPMIIFLEVVYFDTSKIEVLYDDVPYKNAMNIMTNSSEMKDDSEYPVIITHFVSFGII